MTNTLGHEVLETQNLQGKDGGLTNGLFGSNSADTQEALANAFGNQFADRINQAAGGDLDNSGGANFASNLQNSQAVAAGTQRADNVGTAKVEHRQLYVEEAQAIIAAAPAYAVQQGISEEQAKQDLTRQALRIVDQKWSEQIEENPDARAMLAEVMAETAPIEDAYVNGGLVGAFVTTPSDYANPHINANDARMLEAGTAIPGEAGYMSRYATENGQMPAELTPTQQMGETLSGLVDGAINFGESLYNDYPGTMSSIAAGVSDAVGGCVDAGIGCVASDPREGFSGDRAFIDLLQGDRESAISNNNSALAGEMLPAAPVAAKVADDVIGAVGDALSSEKGVSRVGTGNNGSYYVEGEVVEPITDSSRLLEHKQDPSLLANDTRASVVVDEQSFVKYYVKKDDDGNPLYDNGGSYLIDPEASIPAGKYITFKQDVDGLSNSQTKKKLTIESIPGQNGYEQYNGNNVRIDFDVDNPDSVLGVPKKSDYLNDIGGPSALGGARQRVPNETIPLGTMNPEVTKLDEVSIPIGGFNGKK